MISHGAVNCGETTLVSNMYKTVEALDIRKKRGPEKVARETCAVPAGHFG